MFGHIDSPESSQRFMRMMTWLWLPFAVLWLIFATWLGLEGAWWLMGPPALLFLLIGWLREPGRILPAITAAIAFIVIGFWWFAG